MKGFIIDTDSYAGNFEREMCAYMTSVVGDCGVGNEFVGTHPIVEGVLQQPDDNETMRPCAIHSTPGYYNNGMGFAFVDGEEDNALVEYKKAEIKWEENLITTEERHRGKNVLNWTDETIDASIARRMERIKEVNDMTEVSKYSSYQSVKIFFEDDALPNDVVELLKERAVKFVECQLGHSRDVITIENFRIIDIV